MSSSAPTPSQAVGLESGLRRQGVEALVWQPDLDPATESAVVAWLNGWHSPVRVLHVITRYQNGGSQQRLLDAVDAVERAALVVVGAELDPDSISRDMTPDTLVLQVPELVRPISPSSDRRALRALKAIISLARPHIIHTHQSKAAVLTRLLLMARPSSPYRLIHSASMQNYGQGFGRLESSVHYLAELATAWKVDAVAAVGEEVGTSVRRSGVASKKIEVVRSSQPLAELRTVAGLSKESARKQSGLDRDEERLVVCFAGSLDERKGANELVDLGARIARSHPREVLLLVAGEGPLRPLIEDQARAESSLEVRILGHRGDVPVLMRASDVVVLPSRAEGLPQVLFQAALVGTPYATFPVAGANEIQRIGGFGTVVDEFDLDLLARAVVDLDGVAALPLAEQVTAPWNASAVQARYQAIYARLRGCSGVPAPS
ncbi:MAG: glycosyltransferase [Actinomycetia bacterium]|nr:glycosyltransferase [Actinomycetes bacterium]